MKNFKRILVLMLLVFASVLSFSACGNPYKDLKLVVDDGGFEDAFDRSFEFHGQGYDEANSFLIDVSVIGAKKNVSTDVVFTIQDKGVIEEVEDEKVVDGNETTAKFRLKDVGETIITVSTKEGNLSEDIKITSFAKATGLNFSSVDGNENSALLVVAGETIDVGKVMPGYKKPLITFTPSYANRRNVQLSVDNGYDSPVPSDEAIYINGNNITVGKDFPHSEFNLTAVLKDNEKTIATVAKKIRVVKPLDESNLTLAYSSFEKDNNEEGNANLNALEYDANSKTYTLYLADQLSKDTERESKNIYLVTESVENNITTFNKEGGAGSTYSFLLGNKEGKNTSSFINNIGNNKCFAITNGMGIGNYDTYTFNVNYNGYESFYTGITMTVKVVVQSFPTGVVLNSNPNMINVEQEPGNSFYVFNSYYNMMGTQIFVKLKNEGGFVPEQYAYVGIKGYNGAEWYDAPLGAFSIRDANGNVVTPGLTKIKSGEPIYVRFDSTVLTNVDSKYAIYAYSATDKEITSFDETMDYDSQNAKIVLIKDYSFDYVDDDGKVCSPQDILIEVGSGAAEEKKLNLNTVNKKIPLTKFEVSVGNLAKFSLKNNGYADDGYYINTNNGEYGQTYYTIVAPNGFTVSRSISITPRVTEYTEFSLKVNNYIISSEMTININILTKLSLSLVIDGVEFKDLPPTFKMTIERKNNNSDTRCLFDGWQNIRSLSAPTSLRDGELKPDKFGFYLTYGTETIGKNFTLTIYVIKPIKNVTASNAYVSIVSNDIKPLIEEKIDSAIVKGEDGNIISSGYLDISEKSRTKISYYLNPDDASIEVVSFNGKNYLNLTTSIFSFIYENSSIALTEMFSIGKNYGSYVKYDNNEYNSRYGKYFAYDANADAWYYYGSDTLTPNEKLDKSTLLEKEENIELISALYSAKKTFVYKTTGLSGNQTFISFDWDAYIDNNTNRIVIEISNITVEINDGNGKALSNGEFEIRFTYTQTYDISSANSYYVRYNSVEKKYYFTSTNEDNAPELNYIGAYRVNANNIEIDESGAPVRVAIGGVKFDLTQSGGAYSFSYNKYALQMSCNTRITVSKPVKLNNAKDGASGDITMIGMRKDTNGVYLIDLNKNQVKNDYSFSYSYITDPISTLLEKPGMILGVGNCLDKNFNSTNSLTETIGGAPRVVSQLVYKDGKLIGVKSSADWESATGLRFEIDFATQKVKFTILNLSGDNSFENYVKTNNGVPYCEFSLISLDSVMDDNPVHVTLRINLRTGTKENPYIVSDATTFQNIILDIGENTYYRVTNDISLKGIRSWSIIGADQNNSFKAHITTDNDQKFSIYGFNAKVTPAYTDTDGVKAQFKYIGLFGYINGGSIENLTFRDINFKVELDNLYSEKSLYVGIVAGYVAGGSFKNIRIEDDEFVNYESYKHINNLATGNFGRGINFLNTGNQHTDNLSVYIGALAGLAQSAENARVQISNLQVKFTIQVNDAEKNHTYYVGGAVGEVNGSITGQRIFDGDTKVYSVIHSNATNDNSSIGGVIGLLSGKAPLHDVVAISYIYADGGRNIGGVIGRHTSEGEVNNISSTPMIYAINKSQNIGGVSGSVLNETAYKNIKVKFVDHGADNSVFNSSLTGYTNIGGIVGIVGEGTDSKGFIINNASVFSYVSRKNSEGASYVDLDYEQKSDVDGKYYGDIVAYGDGVSNVNVGGFIGNGNNVFEIANAYLNSQIRIITNNVYNVGGVIGLYSANSAYKIKNTTLTGNIFYNGNEQTNYIGNFIGNLSKTESSMNKSLYDSAQVSGKLAVEEENNSYSFNIINSYSIIKSQDVSVMGSALSYINNFTGNADTVVVTDSAETVYMTIKFSYNGTSKTISAVAETKDGKTETFTDLITKGTDETELFTRTTPEGTSKFVAVKEAVLTNIPKNVFTIATVVKEDVKDKRIEVNAKTSDGNLNIKFEVDAVSAEDYNNMINSNIDDLGSITFTVPTTSERSNVLAYNSFYMGYNTNVYFADGSSENYTFNETDFIKSINIKAPGDFKWTKKTGEDGKKDIDKSSYEDVVEVNGKLFNYFNNYGYDNFKQSDYTVVNSTRDKTKSSFVFENFLGKTEGVFADLTVESFKWTDDVTKNIHSTRNSNTYIFAGEDGGYLNPEDSATDMGVYAMYQNRELLDGNVVALVDGAKTKDGKPNLVVDVAPMELDVVVKNMYTASDKELVAIVKVSDSEDSPTIINIQDIASEPALLEVNVKPALANNQVVYTSSDESVFKINSDNQLVVVGEGVGILRVTSKLNVNCFKEIIIIAVMIDRNNLEWQIRDANTSKYYNDYDINKNLLIDIIANDGTTLTTTLNSKGSLTYGMEYKVDFNSVTATSEDKKVELLKNLTIAGQKIPTSIIDAWIASGKKDNAQYTFDCAGLQHAIFGSVLGSVIVEQKLYFQYQLGETVLKCYINTSGGTSVQSKNLKLNFKEGVFGISGSSELSFVVVNRENFVIALNCDSENFDLSLRVDLNDTTITINGVEVGREIRFADFDLGHLIIRLESTKYEENKKLKTFKFSAYLDDEGQKGVQSDENYKFKIMPFLGNKVYEDDYLVHDMDITVSQQQVENINLTHYTNMLYTSNEEPLNGDPYKYQSGVIIPGYTSLLHIDFYPSFGYFDYVEVVSDNDQVSLGQVVEAINMDGKSLAYSWYEAYSEHVNLINRGIRISNRYSTRDYSLGSRNQFEYNGSLFVAINVSTAMADKNISLTITGYKNGVATPLFTQSTMLEVEARPLIEVKTNVTEVIFGGKVPLNIDIQYTSESFSASLKSSLSDAELLGSLASVIYDPELKQYVLYVNDTRYVYINYSHLMYQNLTLSLKVNKLINGVLVTSTSSLNVRLVPFVVEGINLNIENSIVDNKNFVVAYYQSYNIAINVDATYSQGYYNYLLALDSNTSIVAQISNLERMIARNIANYSILSQGAQSNRKALLNSSTYVYSGEFALNFDSNTNITTIRFISSTITGFIWAELGLDYTDDGIQLVQTILNPAYIFTDYISVTIDTSSADDHPEPITSVNDLLNMKEGVSYILLKDLVLLNWSPLDANFKVFDGNGYTLTIMSFANIEKGSGENTNVGIFKSIPEGTIVKNVTIEVLPYNGYTNSDEEYANGEFASNLLAKLMKESATSLARYVTNGITIDVSEYEEVNFGLLAGENLGTITNCKVANNAESYRTARENALNKKVNDSLRINVNYGDNFANVLNKFYVSGSGTDSTERNTNRRIIVKTVLGDETKAKNDNIGLLVGTNSGFITNSSVSKVNIESQEYIGGLVGYNNATGKISSSFVREVNINHNVVVKANSGVGGLVARNAGEIAYSYVSGKFSSSSAGDYPSEENLRAQGTTIKTNSYAGGFVYNNFGVISNCYSNVMLSGSVAGFAYKNEETTSVIKYCYSLSSVKLNDINSYPFANKFVSGSSKLNSGTIIDCFYLYNAGYSNMANDAGTSLTRDNFKDYNAFVGYAFNSDYTNNTEILDAVWYIPDDKNNFINFLAGEGQDCFNSYVDGSKLAPQLVSADAFTLSVRYLIQARTDEYAFTYNYATELGSFTNPILLTDAETYNKSIVSNETRHFRMISDISFNVSDEVSKTYNTTFRGKLDGNNMTFKSLRLNSNTVDTSQEIKKLGMFNTISGRRNLTGLLEYAIVKNVNIEVAQLDGINVNVVGVLAGEISNARIYNINVSGGSVVVQGLNVVGGIAGIVNGDTDLVNLTNSISVNANYYSNYNPFDYTLPYTLKQDNFETFVGKSVLYEPAKNNIAEVSYAGGIVGICNITKRDPEEVDDETLSTLYNNLYRARRLYLNGTPTIEAEVAGGIFGYLSENSNLSDCDVTVKEGMHIKSTRLAGGLVGHNLGEIKRCTIENDNQTEIDALIKRNPKQYDNAKTDISLGVENLYGADDTAYRAMFVGGLVGFMQRGTLLNCYNRVTVASKNSLYAGGLVGIALGGTTLDTCYVTGSVQAYVGIGGVIGYVTDTIGGTDSSNDQTNPLFFENECDSKSNEEKYRLNEEKEVLAVNLTNIVAANIWKYSHLDVSRRSSVSTNATPAFLGSLAGKTYSKLCKKASDDRFNDEQEKAAYIFFSADTKQAIASRAKTERVYYKQTYTYVSIALNQTQKTLINEVGNTTYVLYSDSGAGMFANFEEGQTELDKLYGAYAESLKMYTANKDGEGNITSYTLKTDVTPFFYDKDKGIMSGLFRYSTTESDADSKKLYIVSRAQSFGSLRSLSEIVARKSDIASADALYKDLGISNNDSQLKNIITSKDGIYFDFITLKNNSEKIRITDTANFPIYQNTWEDRVWKGIQLKEDMATLIDEECVFPALKNSVDTWTDVFVYSEDDLQKINRRTTSTFILMNDIYLSAGADVGNFCSTKPFRGTIRSAKVGDEDGNNKVEQNYTFTIFDLDIKPSLSSGNGTNAIGGLISTAIGATFENFNLHVIGIDSSSAQFSYDTKTNAMGVLVGKANSATTIKNVQIIGGKHTKEAPAKIIKGTWNSTQLNLTAVTTDYVPYALSVSGYIKNGKPIFDTVDETSGEKIYADVKGINIEFMGGFVGVATDMIYTGEGVKNVNSGSLNIYDYSDSKLIKGLVKTGSGYTLTTELKDLETANEYIGSCQVKNIRFTNKYYGTTYGGDTPSVVSYMGGYFGLATVNGFAETDIDKGNKKVTFKTTNIDFVYDLSLTNKIDGSDIDKYKYDITKVDTGLYIGAVAGQVKTIESGDMSDVIVEQFNVVNTRITVNTELSSELIDNKKVSVGTVAIGAFGKLVSSLTFKNINVANVNIDYNNGYYTLDDDENQVAHYGVAVNTSGGVASMGISEYFGGFAGLMSDAVKIEASGKDSTGATENYYTHIYNTTVDYTGLFDDNDTSVSGHSAYIGGAFGSGKVVLQKGSTIIDSNLSFNANKDYDVYIGGLMGSYDGTKSTISQIYASGNIKYTQNDSKATENGRFIGGLIGNVKHGNNSSITITEIGTDVDIDLVISQHTNNTALYAGGLLGYANKTMLGYIDDKEIAYGNYSSSNILVYFDIDCDLNTAKDMKVNNYFVGGLIGNMIESSIAGGDFIGSLQITGKSANIKSRVYDLMKHKYGSEMFSGSTLNMGGIVGSRAVVRENITITDPKNKTIRECEYSTETVMLNPSDEGRKSYNDIVFTNSKFPTWINGITYSGSRINPIEASVLNGYITSRSATAKKWLAQIVKVNPYDEKLANAYENFNTNVISNDEMLEIILPHIDAIRLNQYITNKFSNKTIYATYLINSVDYEFSNCVLIKGSSVSTSNHNITFKDATMIVDANLGDNTAVVSVDSILLNVHVAQAKNEGLILYSEVSGLSYGIIDKKTTVVKQIGRKAYEEVQDIKTKVVEEMVEAPGSGGLSSVNYVEYKYTTSRSTAFIAESQVPYPLESEKQYLESKIPDIGGFRYNNLNGYVESDKEKVRDKYLYGNIRNCVAIGYDESTSADGNTIYVENGEYYTYGDESNNAVFGYVAKEITTGTYNEWEISYGVVEEKYETDNSGFGRRSVSAKDKPIIETFSEDYSYFQYLYIFTSIDNKLRVQGPLHNSWADEYLSADYDWRNIYGDKVEPNEDDVYIIENQDQFLYMIRKMNKEKEDYNIKITAKGVWDFSGKLFNPIEYFRGEIDFGGVQLKGLNIIGEWAGLIQTLSAYENSISNVYITDSYILGRYNTGGLIATVETSEYVRSSDEGYYSEYFINPTVINKVGIENTVIFSADSRVGSLIGRAIVEESSILNYDRYNYFTTEGYNMLYLRGMSIVFTGGINDVYTTTYQKPYIASDKTKRYLLVGEGFGATPVFSFSEVLGVGGKVPTAVGYQSNFKNVYMVPLTYDMNNASRAIDGAKTRCYIAHYGMSYTLKGSRGGRGGRGHSTGVEIFRNVAALRPVYDDGTTINDLWSFYSVNEANANDYRYKNNITNDEITAEQIRVENNLPTFRFDSIDWKFDYELEKDFYSIGYNFGLPRLIYDTQYWVDYTSEPSISEGVYNVSTAEQLAWVAKQVNEKGIGNIKIALASNINLIGKVWIPIGTKANPFTGEFDGKGYTISNISAFGYYGPGGTSHNTYYSGLFGYVDGANIYNFTIYKARIEGESSASKSSANYFVGGVVAYSKKSIIKDINVKGVRLLNSIGSIGGIVGHADYNTKVLNCYFGLNDSERICEIKPVRTARSLYIGGIAGKVSNSSILSCKVSNAKIIIYDTNFSGGNGISVGGIVGTIVEHTQSEIKNNWTGEIDNTLLQSNYFRGNIEWGKTEPATAPYTIGMIVGYVQPIVGETYELTSGIQKNLSYEFNGRVYHRKEESDGKLYLDSEGKYVANDVNYTLGTDKTIIYPIVNILETVIEFRFESILSDVSNYSSVTPKYSLIGKTSSYTSSENLANYMKNIRIENVFLYLKFTGAISSSNSYLRYNFSSAIGSTSATSYLYYVRGWAYTNSSNKVNYDTRNKVYESSWAIKIDHNAYVDLTIFSYDQGIYKDKNIYVDGGVIKEASGTLAAHNIEGYGGGVIKSAKFYDYYGNSYDTIHGLITWWNSYEVGIRTKSVVIDSVNMHNNVAINVIYRASSNRGYNITYKGLTMDKVLYAIGNETFTFGAENAEFPVVVTYDGTGQITLSDMMLVYKDYGLFGYVKNVEFKNISVSLSHYPQVGTPSYDSQSYSGVLAKYATNTKFINCEVELNGTIYLSTSGFNGLMLGYGSSVAFENCLVQGSSSDSTVYIMQSDCRVGGLAGYIKTPLTNRNYINNCTIKNITFNSYNPYSNSSMNKIGFGGLVAYLDSYGATWKVTNCKAINLNANINNNETQSMSDKYVGGIVGVSYYTVFTKNTFESGSITAQDYVGGIVGYASLGSIGGVTEDDKNDGNTIKSGVSITGNKYVGGIVGYFTTNALNSNAGISIRYNKNHATINGMQYVGGIIGRLNNWNYNVTTQVEVRVTHNENYGTINTFNNELEFIAKANAINDFRNDSKYVGGIIGYLYTYTFRIGTSGGSGGSGGGGKPPIKDPIREEMIYAPKNLLIAPSASNLPRASATITSNINKGDVSGYNNVGGIVGYQSGNYITYTSNQVLDCKISGMNGVAGITGRIEVVTTTNLATAYRTTFNQNKVGLVSSPVYLFANKAYIYTTIDYDNGLNFNTSISSTIIDYSSYVSYINDNTKNTDVFYVFEMNPVDFEHTYVNIGLGAARYSNSADTRKSINIGAIYKDSDKNGFQLNGAYSYHLNPVGNTLINYPIIVRGVCYMLESNYSSDMGAFLKGITNIYTFNITEDLNGRNYWLTTYTTFSTSTNLYSFDQHTSELNEGAPVGYYTIFSNGDEHYEGYNSNSKYYYVSAHFVVTPSGKSYLKEVFMTRATKPTKTDFKYNKIYERWVSLYAEGKETSGVYAGCYHYSINYENADIYISSSVGYIYKTTGFDQKIQYSAPLVNRNGIVFSITNGIYYATEKPIADVTVNNDKNKTIYTFDNRGGELYWHNEGTDDHLIYRMDLMFILQPTDPRSSYNEFYYCNGSHVDTSNHDLVWALVSAMANGGTSANNPYAFINVSINKKGTQAIPTEYYNPVTLYYTTSLFSSKTIKVTISSAGNTRSVSFTALDVYGEKVFISVKSGSKELIAGIANLLPGSDTGYYVTRQIYINPNSTGSKWYSIYDYMLDGATYRLYYNNGEYYLAISNFGSIAKAYTETSNVLGPMYGFYANEANWIQKITGMTQSDYGRIISYNGITYTFSYKITNYVTSSNTQYKQIYRGTDYSYIIHEWDSNTNSSKGTVKFLTSGGHIQNTITL